MLPLTAEKMRKLFEETEEMKAMAGWWNVETKIDNSLLFLLVSLFLSSTLFLSSSSILYYRRVRTCECVCVCVCACVLYMSDTNCNDLLSYHNLKVPNQIKSTRLNSQTPSSPSFSILTVLHGVFIL